jgi:hypothetical protein
VVHAELVLDAGRGSEARDTPTIEPAPHSLTFYTNELAGGLERQATFTQDALEIVAAYRPDTTPFLHRTAW